LDQPAVSRPKKSARSAATPPDQGDRKKTAGENPLTFVSPLPGRWIRRTECGVGIALLLAASLVQAAIDPGTFAAANNAFAQGKYAEAAQGFESIIARQGYSAPVLFNLANAQQRAGNLGPAILNYERAALLSPHDPGINANLKVARQKAGLQPERVSPLQTAAQALTMNLWSGLGAEALLLLAVALPLKWLWPQARRALNFGSVAAAFALAMAVSALVIRSSDLRRAVVTVPEAVAGVSPVTTAQPMFKLRAGEAVTLQQTHGAFTLVWNHAGQAGWVKTGELARVIPATATLPGS